MEIDPVGVRIVCLTEVGIGGGPLLVVDVDLHIILKTPVPVSTVHDENDGGTIAVKHDVEFLTLFVARAGRTVEVAVIVRSHRDRPRLVLEIRVGFAESGAGREGKQACD